MVKELVASDFDYAKSSFIFLRHGEPEQYAVSNSPLSERGRNQVRNYMRSFLLELRERADTNIDIFNLHSGSIRTQQSSEIADEEIRQIEIPGKSIRYHPASTDRRLFTGHVLRSLIIQQGIERELAYNKWLVSTEDELKDLQIDSPKEVSEDILAFVRSFSHSENKGLYLCWTHETTHASLAKRLYPHESLKIDFVEPFVIHQLEHNRMRSYFRNQTAHIT